MEANTKIPNQTASLNWSGFLVIALKATIERKQTTTGKGHIVSDSVHLDHWPTFWVQEPNYSVPTK